eukprot:2216006-Rhodomonas_salina.2
MRARVPGRHGLVQATTTVTDHHQPERLQASQTLRLASRCRAPARRQSESWDRLGGGLALDRVQHQLRCQLHLVAAQKGQDWTPEIATAVRGNARQRVAMLPCAVGTRFQSARNSPRSPDSTRCQRGMAHQGPRSTLGMAHSRGSTARTPGLQHSTPTPTPTPHNLEKPRPRQIDTHLALESIAAVGRLRHRSAGVLAVSGATSEPDMAERARRSEVREGCEPGLGDVRCRV